MLKSTSKGKASIKARQKIGKYRIVRRLAETGFASVYKAYDTIAGVSVALKIPHPHLLDRGFDYANMFNVKDALCDGTRWHVRTAPANPSVDPYFPIGQAALGLRTEDGSLRVELSTLTPNFERFEVRIDGGGWRPSEESFRWDVHPGSNRLEARTLNRFGIEGPVSTAELEVRKRA